MKCKCMHVCVTGGGEDGAGKDRTTLEKAKIELKLYKEKVTQLEGRIDGLIKELANAKV